MFVHPKQDDNLKLETHAATIALKTLCTGQFPSFASLRLGMCNLPFILWMVQLCVYNGWCYLLFCFPFRPCYSISVLRKKKKRQTRFLKIFLTVLFIYFCLFYSRDKSNITHFWGWSEANRIMIKVNFFDFFWHCPSWCPTLCPCFHVFLHWFLYLGCWSLNC